MNKEMYRLLLKVEPSSKFDGCWNWGAAKNRLGYGKFADGKGGWVLAHRAMWMNVNGAVTDGKEVCHKCDNPSCVNPDHLFVGTHQENMSDCKSKGRAVGHRGSKNGMAKLSLEDVVEIKNSSLASRILADKYGVSYSLIRHIKTGKKWAHVNVFEDGGEA